MSAQRAETQKLWTPPALTWGCELGLTLCLADGELHTQHLQYQLRLRQVLQRARAYDCIECIVVKWQRRIRVQVMHNTLGEVVVGLHDEAVAATSVGVYENENEDTRESFALEDQYRTKHTQDTKR